MNKSFFRMHCVFLFITVFLFFSVLFAQEVEDDNIIIEIPSLELEDESELDELDSLMKSFSTSSFEEEDINATENSTVASANNFSQIPHKFVGGINCIAKELNSQNSFYVGGEDGFVSKVFHPSFKMQTWQVSQLPIKKIAPHPDSSTVTFYESDGSSIHKISSWNWKNRERLFIIRPNYRVTYIAWSANGSYLLVGNTENGIEVFNKQGEIVRIYSTAPGIVLLATTGKREKSIVSYSKNGKITYTSIQDKKKLAECKSEDELINPCIFKNFTRIVGCKNGRVIVVNAYKGEKVEEYVTQGEVIFTTNTNSEEPTWLEKQKKKNAYTLNIANIKTSPFTLSTSKTITSSIYVASSIIVGDEAGYLHILKNENGKILPSHPFKYTDDIIQEIASDGNTLFILKNGYLSIKKGIDMAEEALKGNLDCTSIICDTENVLLWSKDEKKAVYKYNIEKQNMRVVHKPKTAVLSLSVYNNNIVVVEASGLISLINLNKGKVLFSQNIEGAESAVQRGEDHIIVAKNSLGNSASPLFEFNIKTKESVPIRLPGELAFSITRSKELLNTFFCFLFDSSNGKETNLIQFATQDNKALSAKFENLLTYGDEDFSPFIESCKGAIITNLGKDSLIYFNLYSKKIKQLTRSFALPKKAVLVGENVVSLGFDGSITWHDLNNLK